MEKNTLIAIILSTVVLIGFTVLQTVIFPPQSAEEAVAGEETVLTAEIAESEWTSSGSLAMAHPDSQEPIQEQEIVITTNRARITLSNRGGDIIGYELLEHRDGENGVQMAANISASNRAFSVSFGGAENGIIQDLFHVRKIDDYTVGFYKTYSAPNGAGQYVFAKQYSFKPDDYLFRLDVSVDGSEGMGGLAFGDAAYTIRTSPQIGPYFNAKTNKYENRTFMSFYDGKKKKQILKDGETKVYDGTYSWTGVGGKYFEILGIPVRPDTMLDVLYSAKIEVDNYANAQVMMTRKSIVEPAAQDSYYFYVGPRTEKDLKIYNNAEDNVWGLSNLRLNESLESTGILSWLESILKWCMELLYRLVPNWGVSIIILTVIIKIIFFPLTKKSSMGTLKMQEIQPLLKELQAKFKDNPQRLQQETFALYREKKVNPLSSCLPMLIQIPIFIALFNVLRSAVELRYAPFLWIADLSEPENLFPGIFPFGGLNILPILMAVTMGLQSALTPSTGDKQQQRMMMIMMPIMMLVMFYSFPSALSLYWTLSQVLSIVQMWYIRKRYPPPAPAAAVDTVDATVVTRQMRRHGN